MPREAHVTAEEAVEAGPMFRAGNHGFLHFGQFIFHSIKTHGSAEAFAYTTIMFYRRVTDRSPIACIEIAQRCENRC